MQMYCTRLEPKRGLGQGADLGVLTAITHSLTLNLFMTFKLESKNCPQPLSFAL